MALASKLSAVDGNVLPGDASASPLPATLSQPQLLHQQSPSQERSYTSSLNTESILLIYFLKRAGHLIGELAGFDMRVVLADDLLGVVQHSGSRRMP